MKAKDWIKIERDKDGFLADKSRDDIYDSLPVIVWCAEGGYIEGTICKDNFYDWLSELNKVYYTHWMKVVPPQDCV